MQADAMTAPPEFLGLRVCRAVASSLSAVCNSNWQVTVAGEPSGERPESHEAACFRFSFEGALQGESFLVAKNPVFHVLGLRDIDPNTSESLSMQIAAVLRSLEAGAAGFAESLTEIGQVKVRVERIDNPELPLDHVIELLAEPEDKSTRVVFHLCLNGALLAALKDSSAKPMVFPDALQAAKANLDLVMDVELNVTLRFGQRQLSLREVLDLTSGSVVELDRQVDEPVELVLDGRVVARGEAVIIDGNYGMRITQVLQPIVP